MIDPVFQADNYQIARRLLDAAALRQEAIASNIANAETPHYRRLDLAPSFRTELQNAIAGRDVARLDSLRPQITADARAVSVNQDGNTVDLEHELLELGQNTLENTIQTRFVAGSLAKIRLAITGKS